MKKLMAMLLMLAVLLCGAALAEAGEDAGAQIVCAIEDGEYVIRIPDENGDLGWLANDMAQDPSVVRLVSAQLEGDDFVVRYAPVGDGEITVNVKHYIGVACDQVHGWDLRVADGAIQESTGGYFTASPDEAEQDPCLTGKWMEAEAPFTEMTVEKNEGRGWNVEIAAPLTHGAYIFKTTVYYDCDRDAFVYDKGKFWEVPVTESDEAVELGEAALAGTTGAFTFAGEAEDLSLTWWDDEHAESEVVFRRADAASVDYGASKLYTEAEMDQAIALIEAEFATWEGCELHSIRYAGDDSAGEENLKYVNSLEEGRDFTDCIVFLTDFHSPVEGGGAWEADKEYTDYQWFLAREADGAWELLTWGY